MGYLCCLEEHINLKRFRQTSELDSGWISVLTIDGTSQCILEMPRIHRSVAPTQVQFLGSWHLKCSRLQTDCRVFNAGERSDVTPARFAPAGPVTCIQQQQQQQQRQARPKKVQCLTERSVCLNTAAKDQPVYPNDKAAFIHTQQWVAALSCCRFCTHTALCQTNQTVWITQHIVYGALMWRGGKWTAPAFTATEWTRR